MATADCEVRPKAEAPVRPPLEPGERDYACSHDAIFCACEINIATGRDQITKVGHLTAIIDAHFPRAQHVYETQAELLAAIKALVDCCEKQRAFQNPKNTITRDRLRAAQRAIERAEAKD